MPFDHHVQFLVDELAWLDIFVHKENIVFVLLFVLVQYSLQLGLHISTTMLLLDHYQLLEAFFPYSWYDDVADFHAFKKAILGIYVFIK